jgi:hypothetical protein
MKRIVLAIVFCLPLLSMAQNKEVITGDSQQEHVCESKAYISLTIGGGAEYLVDKLRPTITAVFEFGFESGDKLQLTSPTIFSFNDSDNGTDVAMDQSVDLMYLPANQCVGFGVGYLTSKKSSIFDTDKNTWKIMFDRPLNDYTTLRLNYYLEGKKSFPSLGVNFAF